MFPGHKNSYLQGNFHNINAKLLNRSVQKAFDNYKIIDDHDLNNPTINRLTSQQPTMSSTKNANLMQWRHAYGRNALRKLKKELHHNDQSIILSALEKLCDLVHYPESAYEAINLKIIDRSVSLLVHESYEISQQTVLLIKILAGYADGKQYIVNNHDVLTNLLDCIDNEYKMIRKYTAECFEMIAKFWKTADYLIDVGTIQILLSNLSDHNDIVIIHLNTLKSLLYCDDGKNVAFNENAFEIFMAKILDNATDPNIIAKSCELLGIMCHVEKGRLLAKKLNLLPILNRLLFSENEKIHTAAAETLIYCIIISSEKNRCKIFKTMPKRLVDLAGNKLNPHRQLFAIKALTSLSEHPIIRNDIKMNYLNDIRLIQLTNDIPELKIYRNMLLDSL